MDKNYFSKTRILDGGMGKELLKRGIKPRGKIWSAEALLEEKYHKLVIDTHLDFINAGADVIVTTTFTARRIRLIQNKCEEHFEYINTKAVELALKARDVSKKNILVAGGLPNQYQTYSANLGDDLNLIEGGKRKIDGDLLLKVCQELKIELSDLTSKSDLNLANNISELLDDQLFEDLDILGPEVQDLVNTNPKINMSKSKINKIIVDKGLMYFLNDIFE